MNQLYEKNPNIITPKRGKLPSICVLKKFTMSCDRMDEETTSLLKKNTKFLSSEDLSEEASHFMSLSNVLSLSEPQLTDNTSSNDSRNVGIGESESPSSSTLDSINEEQIELSVGITPVHENNLTTLKSPPLNKVASPNDVLHVSDETVSDATTTCRSSSASACLDMSYLTTNSKRQGRGIISGRNPKSQEKNLFSIKRKLDDVGIAITSPNNVSREEKHSHPSTAKKVKFFPLITSTPTKCHPYQTKESLSCIKKALCYTGEQSMDADFEDKCKPTLLLVEAECAVGASEMNMLMSLSKEDLSPASLMDYGEVEDKANGQTISTLVEKFSCKIRSSTGGSAQKRKLEPVGTTDNAGILNAHTDDDSILKNEWSMDVGKYDVKYPTDSSALIPAPVITRVNSGVIFSPQQQYKPLRESFDESCKLTPIQESYKRLEITRNERRQPDYKPSYVRQRCLESKLKPKVARLRRRYKSESDIVEKVVEGKSTNLKTEATSSKMSNYGANGTEAERNATTSKDVVSNIKLYTLTDPGRPLHRHREIVFRPAIPQESVMEVFCEKMHDLQMDSQ